MTVCAYERQSILDAAEARAVLEDAWRQIPLHFPTCKVDEFVVMPNHVHGVIWITSEDVRRNVGAQHAAPLPMVVPGSLGAIVRSFKAAVTKRVNEIRDTPGAPVWQRNYYERVIHSEDELRRVREYILLNPLKWDVDRENPDRVSNVAHDREWGWIEGNANVGAQHAAPLHHTPQGRP